MSDGNPNPVYGPFPTTCNDVHWGRLVPDDYGGCLTCYFAHECMDAYEAEPDWGGEIPFDGSVLPARYANRPARPLVAQRRWRDQFAGDGAGRDGSDEYYEFNGRREWRPEKIAA